MFGTKPTTPFVTVGATAALRCRRRRRGRTGRPPTERPMGRPSRPRAYKTHHRVPHCASRSQLPPTERSLSDRPPLHTQRNCCRSGRATQTMFAVIFAVHTDFCVIQYNLAGGLRIRGFRLPRFAVVFEVQVLLMYDNPNIPTDAVR